MGGRHQPSRIKISAVGRKVCIVLGGVAALGVFSWVLAPDVVGSFVVNRSEDVMFAINPSADRAFEYGERHFSAKRAQEYDIVRAQYFFEKASRIDPNTPFVFHELARIAFLHGNYPLAIRLINTQIEMHGDSGPNSYYIRALIEGFSRQYDASVNDYRHYLHFDPTNWAANNDYAWVLLKAGRARESAAAAATGLKFNPGNPWLLNTSAIALYEIGLKQSARDEARAALRAAAKVTTDDWLKAYPGNDPRVAADGVAAFQEATIRNMHTIIFSLSTSTLQ